MRTISYEVTSLAVSPFGGIAQCCFHTLRLAAAHPELAPSALYRHGSSGNLKAAGVPARKISWVSRVSEPRADIVHALCHRLPPVRSRKIVYTVHDVWSLTPNRWQGEPYQRRLGKRMRRDIARADLIVTDSEWTRVQLLSLGVAEDTRCRTVPLGVEFPPESRSAEIGPVVRRILERPYVLFVGRIENRKNLGHIVEAVRPLAGLSVVLVGESGFGYEEIVRKQLSQMPSDRLIRIDRLPSHELNTLYRHAVATLQPSWEEGFGLPVLEAMAAGSPVITSNGSGCAEVAGEGALQVDASEPEQSRAHLQQLREDSEFRDAIIAKGKERARLFSWERSFAMLADLYATIATT